MILNAFISCGNLLLGSGCCIYRLVSNSNIRYSRILPQFVYASIGIAAISARSVQNLVYHFIWRHYPIDPILAEKEKFSKKNNLFINWSLKTLGFSFIFYSLCIHYKYFITGTIVLTSLVISEVINFLKKKLPIQLFIENLISATNNRRLAVFVKTDFVPYLWILANEFFGLIVNNSFIRLANIPYSLTELTYRPGGFNYEWSVRCSMNDYMMLMYIIFITEAFYQA